MMSCQVAAWSVTSLVIGINLFLLFDFAQSHLPPTLPIHICLAAGAMAYLSFTAYLAIGPSAAERMWATAFRRWGRNDGSCLDILDIVLCIVVVKDAVIVVSVLLIHSEIDRFYTHCWCCYHCWYHHCKCSCYNYSIVVLLNKCWWLLCQVVKSRVVTFLLGLVRNVQINTSHL